MAEVPGDLIRLSEAQVVAQRSERTVRRWLQEGRLRRWEGDPPAGGGSAPVLVSRSELLAVSAAGGHAPRVDEDRHPARGGPDTLRGELVSVDSARRVAEERVRGLERLVAALESEVRELRQALAAARDDVRVAGDRVGAAEAEVRALRAELMKATGAADRPGWWRRLLG